MTTLKLIDLIAAKTAERDTTLQKLLTFAGGTERRHTDRANVAPIIERRGQAAKRTPTAAPHRKGRKTA